MFCAKNTAIQCLFEALAASSYAGSSKEILYLVIVRWNSFSLVSNYEHRGSNILWEHYAKITHFKQ
jgi:hypothetical protein